MLAFNIELLPGFGVAKIIMGLELRVLQTFHGLVTATKVCVHVHLKNSHIVYRQLWANRPCH